MRTRVFLAALLASAAAAVAGGQEVPNVIVERHWVHGDRAVRITLFDNRMAVTTVRENGEQVFLRQLMLGEAEYDIYLTALAEDASEAGTGDRNPLEALNAGAHVTLNLPEMTPSTFSYSPVQMLDLPTARLVAVLDDLQKRVTETSPSEEALRLWNPVVGDRVELFVGGTATVSEFRENGLLILEKSDTGIILAVPPQEWPMIIMKVLPR